MNTIRYAMDAKFTARTKTKGGRRLAVQRRGQRVVVWDEGTGKEVHSFPHNEYTDAIEFLRRQP